MNVHLFDTAVLAIRLPTNVDPFLQISVVRVSEGSLCVKVFQICKIHRMHWHLFFSIPKRGEKAVMISEVR